MNTDEVIEKFIKTRIQFDEIKILKTRPSLLGDLIEFALHEKPEVNDES